MDPHQGRARGSNSRKYLKKMPLHCKLDSRGLIAGGRPLASQSTAICLWEFSLLAELVLLGGPVCPGLRGCPGRRNFSVKTGTVWGKLEPMAALLMGHCALSLLLHGQRERTEIDLSVQASG